MKVPIFHLVGGGIGGAEHVFVYSIKTIIELCYEPLGILVVGDDREIVKLILDNEIETSNALIKRILRRYIFNDFYRAQEYLLSKLAKYIDIEDKPRICLNTKAEEIPYAGCKNTKTIYYIHNPFAITTDNELKYESIKKNILSKIKDAILKTLITNVGKYLRAQYLQGNGVLVTNSDFSAHIIEQGLGIKPHIIYPPVRTSLFKKCSIKNKEDLVICVGRLTRAKKFEICIEVLKYLPSHVKLVIAGNTTIDTYEYVKYLVDLAERLGVTNRVSIEMNKSRSELRELFCRAKVLIHPMRGEHFGIVTVEAMAAGVIPIVWNYGGPSYMVPREFQFSNIKEIPEKVMTALEAPDSLRLKLRQLSKKYDSSEFIKQLKQLIMSQV